ncbi:hypothetical protein PSAB6_60076 [Paraburkholderia sabiae]|nr:hypothetical protein PSAB6_60076 [Paraburkholderia sabiae]
MLLFMSSMSLQMGKNFRKLAFKCNNVTFIEQESLSENFQSPTTIMATIIDFFE